MTQPRVLFIIGSGMQLDTARRVAAHLRRPAELLDVWQAQVGPVEEVQLPGHMAPVTLSRLRAVGTAAARWAQDNPGGLVVAPQDVGLVYRRAIAAARADKARIVLLPDGAVSGKKVTGRSLLGGLVPMADVALRSMGLVAGRHGEMGASRPDVVLSWGPGWNSVFQDRGAGRIVNVGNPRADSLAKLGEPNPQTILICSQPMDHAAIGGAASANSWYAFVNRLAAQAPAGRLRVRLHPAELEKLVQLPLDTAARSIMTSDTSLAQDIGWSGAVVSWASTTMLEAAGARRAVVSLAVNAAAAQLARGYHFQRDPRVVSALLPAVPDFEALAALVEQARSQQRGLADDYLVNIGTAAQTAAKVLDEL